MKLKPRQDTRQDEEQEGPRPDIGQRVVLTISEFGKNLHQLESKFTFSCKELKKLDTEKILVKSENDDKVNLDYNVISIGTIDLETAKDWGIENQIFYMNPNHTSQGVELEVNDMESSGQIQQPLKATA